MRLPSLSASFGALELRSQQRLAPGQLPGLALPNFLLALMIMLFSTVVSGTADRLFSNEFRMRLDLAQVCRFLCHVWLPIFILGWSATAFAIQTVRALMSDEIGKLYVTAAARGVSGRKLLWRYPARHALGRSSTRSGST